MLIINSILATCVEDWKIIFYLTRNNKKGVKCVVIPR